jgi:hypothetical protein
MIIRNLKLNKDEVLFLVDENSKGQFCPVCLVGKNANHILQMIADNQYSQIGTPTPFISITTTSPDYNDALDVIKEKSKSQIKLLLLFKDLDKNMEIEEQFNFFSKVKNCKNIGIVFTTKTPYFISDCQEEDVYICNGKKILRPDFQTFGASINLITMKVLNIQETIAKRPMNYLDKAKKNLDKEALLNGKIGDSIERTLLFSYICKEQG